MGKKIHVYPNKKKLATEAAERVINVIGQATRERGLCNIALAGGKTPREVYSMLATDTYRDQVTWSNLHLFWGDERMVPPEHQDSNFRIVKETLLDHVMIPDENVHRIRGEIAPEKAATEYAELLHNHFKEEVPRFDLILLGIGEDGHIASLFPGTDAVEECKRYAVAVFVSRLNTWRVTLTFPVINAAREVFLLVSGRSKADIVRRMISIKQPAKECPASIVIPENGILHWMLDSEAMVLINKSSREVMFPY